MFPQNILESSIFFQQDPIVEDISYRSPTPSGSVYFAEHFDDINQFNKKWVLSEAKKDDIDDDIAKYDG
jgi:calnexin